MNNNPTDHNFLIGIDLGTTNTVVNYINLKNNDQEIKTFAIPQITEFNEYKSLESLPSFIFLPQSSDDKEKLSLPWDNSIEYAVGSFAAKNSATLPQQVIFSAKSWLSQNIVNRKSDILPWSRADGGEKISPLKAATLMFDHISKAWDNQFAQNNDKNNQFAKQFIVVTVPASFDAIARELTMEAALELNLDITIQEEPLAAFYSWLFKNENSWREQIEVGDTVLICDIGGGTSDFTLIKASENNESKELELERLAVGNHLLLGGDNMDFATAYTAAAKFQKEQNVNLNQQQISGLIHACRMNKEQLLSRTSSSIDNNNSAKLTVLGAGSSLIGGSIFVEINRNEIINIILNGFFPECELHDEPQKRTSAGLKTFGLSYESDPAISKHLAHFIKNHCHSDEEMPNKILFNGGVTNSELVRSRITQLLMKWTNNNEICVLNDENPNMAVAHGAVGYALVKNGSKNLKVKAGSSHAYYIGIESSMPAIPGFAPPMNGVCIVPIGMEEGSNSDINVDGLGLLLGEESHFNLYSSTERTSDTFGDIVENIDNFNDETFTAMPTLKAFLPKNENSSNDATLVPIKLHSELLESGTLYLSCINTLEEEQNYQLEFELRGDKEKFSASTNNNVEEEQGNDTTIPSFNGTLSYEDFIDNV
ncbi:Hsp70 family protein [Lentisphaerota bacterium WC36G]|nr:Hsp70 family protein [Lentisphaerae bacterium WC36]